MQGIMHLNKEWRAEVRLGRGAPRAVEVIHLGLATDCNTSEYKQSGKILISNQVRFNESFQEESDR